MLFIMKGAPGFMAWFAIKCSSFVAVNAGTSARSACAAVGFLEHASVRLANCLLERTILLIMLVQACNGVWALEQPGSSTLEYYPAWLYLMTAHYNLFGEPVALLISCCSHFALCFSPQVIVGSWS